MKKFLLIIFFIFCFLLSDSYAFSELYLIRNTDKNIILPVLKNFITQKNYEIKKEDPVYAVSQKKAGDYAVIILTPSAGNLLYYYEANDKNTKLQKEILKYLKNSNYVLELSNNQTHINSFTKIAANTILGKTTKYTFYEIPDSQLTPNIGIQKQSSAINQPNQNSLSNNYSSYTFAPPYQQNTQTFQPQQQEQRQAQQIQQNLNNAYYTNNTPPLSGNVCIIPQGMKFNVYLQNSLSTASAKAGDAVTGIVSADWIYNGQVIAQAGSILYGQVTKARSASVGTRNGFVEFIFNQLVTPQGQSFQISIEPVDFKVTDEGKITRILGNNLMQDALIGASLGALVSSNHSKGALIGLGAGVAAALLTNLAQKGNDAEIPTYTEIEIQLDKPLTIIIN